MTSDSLFLHEEMLLLALRDRQGTVPIGTMYQYALGGAVLAELLLSGRIRLGSPGKKRVPVVNTQPTGEPVLDECLEKLAQAKRPGTLQTWVAQFARIHQLKHRIASELCLRGILRADEDKVLGIFRRRTYPEIDPGPENRLIDRIRRAVLSDSTNLEPRTIALVSLADHSGLLKLVLRRAELKRRKARIAQIINGEPTGEAVKEAIELVQAATTIAAIIPAITSV